MFLRLFADISRIWLAALLVLAAHAGAATAQDHNVALIIGNSDYQRIKPLANPRNDAELAARVFADLGFETSLAMDQDLDGLRDELARFKTTSAGADVALIYFAGHGMQVDNRNYLLAVDTYGISLSAAVDSALLMDEMIAAFADDAAAKVLLLDACHNNPFAAATRSLGATVTNGLARSNHTVSDLMVFYAAQPNNVALDGPGANSPFIQAIADSFTAQATISLQDALVDVTNQVRTQTANAQMPYQESSLSIHIELRLTDEPSQTEIAPQCQGNTARLGLGAVPEDFLELTGKDNHLMFGESVSVCVKPDSISVSGPFSSDFACADLMNVENEGMGYYFQTEGVPDQHLWFYIDPDRRPHALEIGVYRGDQETYWIDTNLPICEG